MVQQVTQLPSAPQRIDAPGTFIVKADSWVAAIDQWTTEVNTLSTEVNTLATNAETSAQSSASSATGASDSEAAALATANFVGEWSTLTGALNIPASVRHDDKWWQLLSDLADVTLSEPGVTADWVEVAPSLAWVGPETTNSILTPQRSITVDTSGGIVTKQLPASLTVGDYFVIHVFDDLTTGNDCLIDPNGNTITFRGSAIDPLGDGFLAIQNGNTARLVVLAATEAGIV